MEMIFEPLVQYGALGLFCIFLIVQYTIQGRKIDAQKNKFVNALETLRASHQEREEAIRAEYKQGNDLLRSEIETQRTNHTEIFSQFRQHVINAHGHQKDQMTKLREAVHQILKEDRQWRQEEKLRMARKGEEI